MMTSMIFSRFNQSREEIMSILNRMFDESSAVLIVISNSSSTSNRHMFDLLTEEQKSKCLIIRAQTITSFLEVNSQVINRVYINKGYLSLIKHIETTYEIQVRTFE